jgi:hypothetical protein
MTSLLGRTYVVAGSLLAFFVLWAGIAARPWASATTDPRLAALDRREVRVRREAAAAQALVARRWAAYRAELAARTSAAAAAPAAPRVRVVTLPPITSTRTS